MSIKLETGKFNYNPRNLASKITPHPQWMWYCCNCSILMNLVGEDYWITPNIGPFCKNCSAEIEAKE